MNIGLAWVKSLRHRVVQQPLVRHTCCDVTLRVRRGSLRQSPDYDDAWLLACAQRANAVFDVGANVGQSALLCLALAGVKTVVLVDAGEKALSVAAENLIVNGLSARARFVCAFASDRDGEEQDFWTIGTGAAGSMYKNHAVSAAAAGAVQRVPTTTLDSLAEHFGIVPDLVKMDIEGAERLALAGSTKIMEGRQTRFLVEMHKSALSMADNTASVLELCKDKDYIAWYLKDGTRLDSPQVLAHRGRCHLLLQPSDWPFPDWLVGIPQSAPLDRVYPLGQRGHNA